MLAYTDQPLLNKYDAYQHIMSYWAELMQDDSYLIAADGWVADTYRIIEVNKKDKEIDKGWTCDLIPKSLLINRYFKQQQQEIEAKKAELESIQTERSELEEQHSVEDGFFTELDKINKAHVSARLKEIKCSKIDSLEEESVLNEYLKLLLLETIQKKTIRDAETELDNTLLNYYHTLSTEQIKQLVVDDKWMASIEQAIQTEMDKLGQKLTQRIKELAERYQTPMPVMNQQVQTLEQTVNEHLAKMGFSF